MVVADYILHIISLLSLVLVHQMVIVAGYILYIICYLLVHQMVIAGYILNIIYLLLLALIYYMVNRSYIISSPRLSKDRSKINIIYFILLPLARG